MAAAAIPGCQGLGSGIWHRADGAVIRHVACIYDQKPWLNLDAAGDRDPEGIHYRVFLDPGTGQGVWCEGTFHVEMYEIMQKPSGGFERTLASDWHQPTSAIGRVKSRYLGAGYHLMLRWASKDIAGHDIEIVTRFEDRNGNIIAAGTKRFQVPQYD